MLCGTKDCAILLAGSNGGSVPTLSNPPPSGSACNGYLPTNAYDRFLWVINFFASNGFYVVSLLWSLHGFSDKVQLSAAFFPSGLSAMPVLEYSQTDVNLETRLM